MDEYTNATMDNNTQGSDAFLEGLGEPQPAEETQQIENTQPEEPEAEEATTEPAKEEPEKPQTIKIKYDKQEREITLDEAVELAQKGMNYDRLIERQKNSREYTLLDKLAEKTGVTREKYLDMLEQGAAQETAKKTAEELAQKYPDMSPDALNEMGQMAARLKQLEEAQSEAQREQEAREAAQKPMMEFVDYLNANYADADFTKDITKLPQQVLDDIKAGKDPVRSMQAYELAEAKRQAKELAEKLELAEKTTAKNKQNKQQSVGSANGNVGDSPVDSFLQGLFGG